MEAMTSLGPPPLLIFEKNQKIEEKYYNLKTNEKEYDLIISLYDNKLSPKEKIFNFSLTEQKESNFSYEADKNTNELIKLFLMDHDEINNKEIEKKIFEKIEKFSSNNNIRIIQIQNNQNIINLAFIIKTIDDEDIKILIELNKTENFVKKDNNNNELLKQIHYLKNKINMMEQKYEKIISEQKDEIKELKLNVEKLINSNNGNKIRKISEENQLIFKSDYGSLNNIKLIESNLDGGRGLNDYFEVYHLHKDPNTVYIAVKCKELTSNISYIDIIKMSSINNIKNITKLSGHNHRIVFVKYFINPYTLKEYLLSGDRDVIIKVWEIIDEKNYKLLCSINTEYGCVFHGASIYNCILYFTENRSYIITTTITNDYHKIYDLDNGAFVKNISITFYFYTLYLTIYKDFIIDCCKNFVAIYQPINEQIIAKIENDYTNGDNRSACVIYNKNGTDYLNISNQFGYVIIYDLKKNNIIYTFNLNKKDLYHIIFWDLNHLIVAQYNSSEYLSIIDIDNRKEDNLIKIESSLMCVKKILLNKNEEILLTSGENSKNIFVIYSCKTPMSSNNKK